MLVVGALAVLAGASVARNRHQTGRAAASRSALHALRVHSRSGPEIVFALRSPVPAGTVVRDGGPARPGSAGRARHSSTRVVARTKGRAWFFYEDLAPFREYAHAGRVVVVDVSSGRVTVSRRLSWPPTLNGRLPVFLASQTAYLSSRYRVFYRPYVGVAAVASRLSSRMSAPGVRRVPAALDPTRGAEVAALLASEHACVVRFSDTVPGGYYAFAHIAQSRGALAFRFSQLANFARGFQSFIYSRTSGVSATAFVTSLISSHGCRDVMLYMAGGGYPGTGAVNIGMGISASDALHQDVTAAALRGLVGANPGVDFELVLDAPYTAAFQSLERIENVLLVASAVAPDGGSFTYLPEARVGGRLVSNHTNPLHVLQLTDRLAFGLDRVIDRRAEVAQLVSLNRLGKLPSVLAYVVARAFALGGPVDFVARTGVGSAPSVHFHGFTAGPPSGGGGPPPVVPPVVTARPDSYTVALPGPLSVTAVDGVLANDSDSAGNVLRVDKLNGTGLAPPLHGTSAKGAAVTLNEDGSFTYDPAGVAALQGAHGQSVTDTFSYRATDRKGGLATATVSITVSGVNHPPVAVDDTASTANDAKLTGPSVLANDTDADGDKLTVDQLNGSSSLSGTSAKGAAVTLNSDGTYSYDPTGSATLQAIPRGQTTTDTFTYRASDGHGGTATATVTVTVVGVANHPPVANPDSYAVDNGVLLTVSSASSGVLANDTDPDLDSLTIDRLNGTGGTAPFTGTSAKGATVKLNADGTFTYDPTNAAPLHPPNLAIGQSTADTFTYGVNDGHGGTATGTVTVTVTAVDTPPTANDFTVATNVVGNTLIEVGTQPSPSSEPKTTDATSLAAHSSDPDIPFGDSLTFSAPAISTSGGNVSVTNSSAGAFTYRSAPGFTGTDTFTYTATDSFGKSATGQVTLHVSRMVWYVQNNAPGPHDGRSGSPFSTLASAESATGSAAGDFIYVFKGDGTTTGQNSGITLKNNQTLLSEKYNLVVGSQTLATGNPTNRPAIGNGAGDGITLAAGDTVTGFDITGTGGGHFAIAGGSGDASGAIADDILHGTGSAGGLTLNGTSGTWSVSDLTATGTGGAAFDANAAGTVTFTGTNSLTGSAAGAFKNASATTYSGTIGTTSSTGGTADGIDASGASGSITFDGGTLSGTTSNAILASGGNANVTYSGTETNTAGHSVNVNARTGGTISIQSPINDTGTGITIANNTAGTTTINGAGKTINTGTSPAISITGNTAQTVNITGGGLNVNTTSGDGVNISGPAAVTLSGGSDTIDSTSGTALHISGASAGTITSDAQINGSATNTGHSIDISGHTGGAITQTGNITDHGTGLTMTNNTGATVSLTGAITASTGASTAFNATGGGTITATAPASTLTTTTGTALNVQNTTIGASGLTFRSLTAGTATGSSGDGIVLDTTGFNGGLTITGNSSGTCGGSVSGTTPSLAVTAPSSADCTGGVIQHKTGADGSTTSGIGIYLNNTANVSLNRMSLHDFDNFGILGSGVSGLAISNSQFTGSNGTSQTGSGEGAAYFSGLSGSTSVTNSFFSGGALDSFHLENNVNQVLNRITFSGDNFGDTLNATSGSALFMQADCTAQLNMTVNTSVFTAARSNNLNVSIRGQSTDDLAVSNSQFSNSDPNQVSGGSNLAVAAGGPGSGCADNTLNPALTYNIHDNTFRDALGTAISISKGGVGTGTFGTTANPGTIDHNTIGVSGNSTSSGAGGIGSILVGGGRITTNITNNTIHGAINGISVGANSSVAGGGQGTYDAEIQGNTIDTPNVGAGNVTNGLLAQFGSVATDNPKACLTLGASAAASKNSLDGGRNGGADLRLRVRFGTLIGILGYAGANNDDTAMTNFLSGQNTIGTGGVVVTNNASTGSGWTGSCPA
jgi:hypothetical protein